MKKNFRLLLAAFVACALLITASASAIVSPALNVLSKQNTLIKSGLVYSDIYFSEQDFKKCLGLSAVDSVKVSALPPESDGALKLGTLQVAEGQTIRAEYLSVLRFVPASEQVRYTRCTFSHDGTEIPCALNLLDTVNYAPALAAASSSVKTYRGVACYGNLAAADPEGDRLEFQVVEYPAHGVLTMTDSARGAYVYAPAAGYTGSDAFTVVVRDEYGNYSGTQTVSVQVGKSDTHFADAQGHWCENAAIALYDAGIATAVRYQNGLHFCPTDAVSREEFVTMVMKALDVSALTDAETSFADNAEIAVEYRPYIATAQRMGYVGGREADGEIRFAPKDCITRAEAAVLVNNVFGYEADGAVSVFADDSAIPTWARGAVYALTAAGVFNGDGDGTIRPSALLDRAATVQMLYNIMDK